VVALVLEHSLRLAGIGLGAGAAVALAGSRLAAGYLESMNPFEPLAYAAALAIVVVACLGASYFPSVRATRVDPMEALRRD
jgi:ABC-type antimicrobial peptide transport system permease subunit